MRRLLLAMVLVGLVAAGMVVASTVQRRCERHDADDPAAPGSVDHWPPVPRRPED